MVKRKCKSKNKMMGACKFTAAACGADGAGGLWARANWSSEGERWSIMREDCHQNFSTTQKHHFYLHHFTKKKKKLGPFLHHPTSPEKNVAFFSSSLSTLFFFPPAPLQVDQLMCNELFESLQVLSVQLHVIVPGPLHPERLHGALPAFIQSQAMGEVDDLVLRTVDHQYRWCYLRNLVDALE